MEGGVPLQECERRVDVYLLSSSEEEWSGDRGGGSGPSLTGPDAARPNNHTLMSLLPRPYHARREFPHTQYN